MSYAKAGRWLCQTGAALGGVGLLGWITGWTLLTTMVPDQPQMMPNTAVALLLVGVAASLRYRETPGRVQRLLSLAASLVAFTIGVGTLAEYALEIDLGIDRLLAAVPAGPYPGRPSPVTATALSFLGAALLLVDVRPRARARPSEWLTLCACVAAFVGLLGFVYGADPIYRLTRAPVVGVAVPTAVSLLLTK
jgi:hypothetical protein